MHLSSKFLMVAALIAGGAAGLQPSPASAQHRPWYGRAPEGDTYAPFVQNRAGYYYGNRGYGGGYYGGYGRPGYYGYRGYGGYPYRSYHRRGYYGGGYYGGAVAAGVLGGLALGTLANPYYGYGPAYYAPRTCVVERRRVINRYGHPVWRRVRACY